MIAAPPSPAMVRPHTVDAALEHLAQPGAAAVGGATWLMRAGLRHDDMPARWVALDAIDALQTFKVEPERVVLGALVTHDRLATGLPDDPALRALVVAAGASANPGVRRLATLGGNLCATGFAAADLMPALLALDATVDLATPQGPEQSSAEMFLQRRSMPGPWLMTGARVARGGGHSAHIRLPMRKAGDYPVAIVSLWLDLDGEQRIRACRLAVGAVEGVARRWHRVESAATGHLADPARIEHLAQQHLDDFAPRTGLDAPGWYRLQVLPALVRRAVEQCRKGA
ncbi:MAG: FAD binding domain-containing protein [Pararhodobacter sp.]|nr:FAD binding domain-containing protein [Pararhodobacter sp.]